VPGWPAPGGRPLAGAHLTERGFLDSSPGGGRTGRRLPGDVGPRASARLPCPAGVVRAGGFPATRVRAFRPGFRGRRITGAIRTWISTLISQGPSGLRLGR
jgi:hypothetical protein